MAVMVDSQLYLFYLLWEIRVSVVNFQLTNHLIEQ